MKKECKRVLQCMFFSAVDVFAVQLVFCTACINLFPSGQMKNFPTQSVSPLEAIDGSKQMLTYLKKSLNKDRLTRSAK